MPDNAELSSCPFCGSKLVQSCRNRYGNISWTFGCTNEKCFFSESYNRMSFQECRGYDEASAIKAMNRRAN